jgi:hypothetical protein
MKTILSTRREKFNRLVAADSVQSSEWLIAVLKDKTRNMTALSRLACLRILVYRNYDPGLPYPLQKKLARIAFGI